MLNRFVKLLAGILLILVGVASFYAACKSNRNTQVTVSSSMDPCSEAMLIFGMIVGLYGAYLIYAGWNPAAAAKLVEQSSKTNSQPPPIPTALPQIEDATQSNPPDKGTSL